MTNITKTKSFQIATAISVLAVIVSIILVFSKVLILQTFIITLLSIIIIYSLFLVFKTLKESSEIYTENQEITLEDAENIFRNLTIRKGDHLIIKNRNVRFIGTRTKTPFAVIKGYGEDYSIEYTGIFNLASPDIQSVSEGEITEKEIKEILNNLATETIQETKVIIRTTDAEGKIIKEEIGGVEQNV